MSYQPPPPNWQQPQPPPPKKKPGTVFWIITVTIGLMICVLIGGAIASRYTDSSSISTPTTVPDIGATNVANSQATQDAITPVSGTPINTGYTPPPSNANSGSNFKAGQTGSVDSFIATLNKTYTSTGNEFNTPSKGNQYLVVDVSVKNTTGQVQHMASNQFTLIDSTGQRIDDTIATLPNVHFFVGGTLQDGSTMRGQLIYQVPTGNHPYQMTFQGDSFSDNQLTWDIHS